MNRKNTSTLVGLGPMSKNCVDVVLELDHVTSHPLMLVTSRRQIDCKEFGGGYVNHWSTEEFAKYVLNKNQRVILCRDHGGPWQTDTETFEDLSVHEAMRRTKVSLEQDILSGFRLLHLDPISSQTPISHDDYILRTLELYEHCIHFAKKHHRQIGFEIGFEENDEPLSFEETEYLMGGIIDECEKQKWTRPSYFVFHIGTRVRNMKNVGLFESQLIPSRAPEVIVPEYLKLCERFSVQMKIHNADYLSGDALSWFPRLGIHAANIAPELGTTETIAFLELLKSTPYLREKFLEMSFDSRKWVKWLTPDGNLSSYDKAVIAGHYLFSTPVFKELKQELSRLINLTTDEIDSYLQNKIKNTISRILKNLNLIPV